jgi:hypothetical protein
VIGLTKRVEFFDKNAALEKAMKHLGLYERDNSQKKDPIRELPDLVAVAPGGRCIDLVRKTGN